MSRTVIIEVVFLFIVGQILLLAANYLLHSMIEDIKRSGAQVDVPVRHFFLLPWQVSSLIAIHKRLFRDSKKDRIRKWLTAGAFGSMALIAILLIATLPAR